MSQQDSVFDTRRTVERTLSTGSSVKVTLEPLGSGQVKIVEYRRKPRHGEAYMRQQAEEGVTVPYEGLQLTMSYAELFGAHAEAA